MHVSEAHVPTASASRYLQQICKHWSHKFAVEFTPEAGCVPFSEDRRCDFSASADTLTMRIHAADEATLERTQQVVLDHLKRFAFREDLGDIRWTRVTAD
ncbi:DUF2218 domain-containing protein [Pseudorhodoplanes sp.]|uniref:DUF2218 domain-containing protein n=1 Tax=Pseudorhodoplanes sp. TaxID=1934341 RepID=UPI002C5697C9|nr:DUF2218 domain-containing protein [Pseudorhodoplanes sp.]HWV53344.1 DUF2218 domain-containing protein [Pseudorhodoplanes sp.]